MWKIHCPLNYLKITKLKDVVFSLVSVAILNSFNMKYFTYIMKVHHGTLYIKSEYIKEKHFKYFPINVRFCERWFYNNSLYLNIIYLYFFAGSLLYYK